MNSIDLGRFLDQVTKAPGVDKTLAKKASTAKAALEDLVIANYASTSRQGAFGSEGLAIYSRSHNWSSTTTLTTTPTNRETPITPSSLSTSRSGRTSCTPTWRRLAEMSALRAFHGKPSPLKRGEIDAGKDS